MSNQEKASIQITIWNEDVTLKTISQFEDALRKLNEAAANQLILDLQDVQYMNSAGLGIMVDAVMRARKDEKQVVLANVNETLMEIFNIVKIGTFINIFPTPNDAIEFYKSFGAEQGA